MSDGHSDVGAGEERNIDFGNWTGGVEPTSRGCHGAGPTWRVSPGYTGGHRLGGVSDKSGAP